jgi:tetratricopeptide (TPR) repeat protein
MEKDGTVRDRRRQGTLVGVLVALLFGLGPVALHAQQKEGEKEQPKQECNLTGTDLTQRAEKEIDDAVKAKPDSVGMASFQSALRLLKVALAQNDKDPAALWLRGRAQVGLHQYAGADSALNDFIALKPGCQHLVSQLREQTWVELYNRGVRAYQGGDEAGAMALFDTANIMQGDPRSLNNSALLHERAGDTAMAESLYRRTLKAGGDSLQERAATINLALLLKSQKKDDEAMQVYRDYIAAHPKAVTPRINMAVDMAQSGQPDSAKAILAQLLGRQDLSYSDLNDLGTGFLQIQDPAEAEKAFEQANKANPYDKDGYMNLLQAAVAASDFKTAADVGSELLDRYPYEKDAFRAVAQSLDRLGRKKEVQTRLRQMQTLPLEFIGLKLNGRGGTYQVQGQVSGGTMSGKKVTIPFTFYGADGSKVAQKAISLTVPGQNEVAGIQFQVQSDKPLVGFTYGKVQSGS